MKIKGKKGWIRIVEAFIAVLIVASVLILLVTRTPRGNQIENVHETQRFILEQIAANETLRGEILNNDNIQTENFIRSIAPVYWNFTTKVCEIEEICRMSFYLEKEIYADEILIASNLTKYSPKKLKLFVWAR